MDKISKCHIFFPSQDIKQCVIKVYLRYKMITSQNVSFEAQVKKHRYFIEKLCYILKIFKFLYF